MDDTRSMDFAERYRAIQARDPRFDGQFITAVSSTGIYCRPSCPARTPKPENVTFYATSAAAHEAGFRACKRCLPEAVPGTPAWNLGNDVAARSMRLIADGVVEREGVPGLASRLGYSSRHLTRILSAELGAGPLALARAHRAQGARQLLTGTDLPFGDIAFAAGFSSIRQFNDTMREVFELTPGELRAKHRTVGEHAPGSITLSLPFRRPFDAAGVFAWLAPRAVDGVELAGPDHYARLLALPGGTAWFEVRQVGDDLRLTAEVTDLADLPVLVSRVRRLFDLDADPTSADAVLAMDPRLAASVAATPGIRLPGAVDPEEMLVRAMVGQQITVAAARTQLRRLADEVSTTVPERHGLHRLFPTATQIANGGEAALVGPRARIDSLLGVARALMSGELTIGFGDDRDELRTRLLAMKGIGPWTADYVSMRVLGNPDAFLPGDVAVRTGAGRLGLPSDARTLTAEADAFAPWRSYLCLHLWKAASTPAPTAAPSALEKGPAA
ncbi:DNA-3-methyladenine glycosylase 2 [Plantibacter cousiniae (nom. nud.)]|uniref:DNA-3-methyladenine glycosylase 2 n=1 Tax=Plantibacter cousiniae (nom. nud.) TaxID=199709 RepID=UPI001D4DF47A|nr:DNA-3-methyladenine glycosylase 2 [Plantibacter cousiniae]CAH0229101.1 putative bifunctional transcriptional activator/DNA repair enzyme AlkA [Plantibacter cousiniae]